MYCLSNLSSNNAKHVLVPASQMWEYAASLCFLSLKTKYLQSDQTSQLKTLPSGSDLLIKWKNNNWQVIL